MTTKSLLESHTYTTHHWRYWNRGQHYNGDPLTAVHLKLTQWSDQHCDRPVSRLSIYVFDVADCVEAHGGSGAKLRFGGKDVGQFSFLYGRACQRICPEGAENDRNSKSNG